jgi:glutathione synthase/RimK-type ligase-like ATP-grasp enzyme
MKALFFTCNKQLLDDFLPRLVHDGITATIANYDGVDLLIDGENTSIRIRETNEDLTSFDAVVCISTPKHELIDIYSSIGCYCRKNHIKMIDDTFTNTSGKLYEMWRFYENGIPVPKTAYGSIDFLKEQLEKFGGIGILKATRSKKGGGVFLVKSEDEIDAILNTDESRFDYILQNFIENDGDYRVITIDFEPKLAILRSSGGKDYRNNTSLGGNAKIVDLDEELSNIAAKAAKATDIKFAGVDIIEDKNTGERFVLEINRTPQFTTGTFTDEKYNVLKDYLLNI